MTIRMRRTAGAVLLVVVALVFMATLIPAVEFPAGVYALFVVGLFAGAYLIGISRPGPTV